MPSMLLSPVAAREAVHLLILRELAKVRGGETIVVKGGVNLRLFFGSIRYSEDIDLDGEIEASRAIRSCINGIFRDPRFLKDLRRLGIRGLDPGEGPNKDSETTFRYKFGLVLPGDIRHPTKVEVSFREKYSGDRSIVEAPNESIFAAYGLEPVAFRRYVREAAVRQKIDALGGRREAQARDVFDLHILLPNHASEGLLTFLSKGLERQKLDEAYERAFAITFEEYEGQVVEFLEEDARSRFGTEAAWDELRLEVATLVEAVRKRKGD